MEASHKSLLLLLFLPSSGRHNYERTFPLYRGSIDPSGSVFIVNGAGGNREGVANSWSQPAPAWSALRASVAGVGLIHILNSTTIQWQFWQQNNKNNNGTEEPTLTDEIYLQARNRGAAQWGKQLLLEGEEDATAERDGLVQEE